MIEILAFLCGVLYMGIGADVLWAVDPDLEHSDELAGGWPSFLQGLLWPVIVMWVWWRNRPTH